MDVLLQRHCAKYIYVVPDGLRELMSDISREVLRSQPDEIYTFIADYLDALLITRENARVAARLVESITAMSTTIAELFIRTGMSREEANAVAAVIQLAFRKNFADRTAAMQQQLPPVSEAVEEANIITQILDECNITPDQAEQAAVIIQNAYRNFKRRQERETDLLKGMVDWRVAARSTMRLYRKLGVTYEEANRAATLIKAAYKGYYTRRIMKRLLEESERVSVQSAEEEEEESYEPAIYFEQYGQADEMEEMYEDIEAVKKEGQPEAEEDTETMVRNIMDNLLKRVVPDLTTSVAPPPSEVDGSALITKTETDDTAEGSLKAMESEGGSPGETVEGSPMESPTEQALGETTDVGTDTPAAESPPTQDEPTEAIQSPEADTAATDTEAENTDATTAEATDTEATTE